MTPEDKHEEKMVLGHDPVPGYKPVFLAVFTASVLYLAFVFSHSPF